MPHPIRLKPSGLAGSPPPADAPREVSQPLTAAAQAEMVAKARAHQGLVSPAAEATMSGVKISELASPGMVSAPAPRRPPIPSPEGSVGFAAAEEGEGVSLPPSPPDPPLLVPASASSPDVSPAALPASSRETPLDNPHALPALPPDATPEEIADPVVNARPSRGQPKPVADPTLRPTGGFGVPGAEGVMAFGEQGEYFPLDGSELREVVLAKLDELVATLGRDLRFTIATTYPLARVTVTIHIECDQPDQTFTLTAVHDEARGMPPDLAREQLGLAVPRKQAVQTPMGTVMVDRLN